MSTLNQREDRQLDGLELDRRFVDHVSGKDTKRPQLTEMLTFIREGDTVVCHSMDRLGRNLDDLRKLVFSLTERRWFRQAYGDFCLRISWNEQTDPYVYRGK